MPAEKVLRLLPMTDREKDAEILVLRHQIPCWSVSTPEHRKEVFDALVELVYAFHPNGDGPHFSGGTIGMVPTVRALAEGGRDDVLWIFSRRTTSLVAAAAG